MYRKDYILRKLLGIVLWQKTQKEPVIDAGKMLTYTAAALNVSTEEVLSNVKENKEDLIFEAEVFYGSGADIAKDTAELILNLSEEYLKEELAHRMRELHLAEKDGDRDKANRILQECQILNQKIQDIKNKK